MTKKKILCHMCNKEFTRGSDRVVIRGVGTLHPDCYKEHLLDKYPEDYVEQLVHQEVERYREKKKRNAEKQKNKLVESSEYGKERDKFVEYIKEVYDTNLPKNVFVKLSRITTGTYEGVKEAISYDDLLFMFQSKRQYLDKVYMNNVSKGKEMSNLQRFQYDLAVMLNKYDSYKAWKEKQKLLEIEERRTKEEASQPKIDYSKIKADVKRNDDSSVDIGDIIGDLY